MRELEFVPAWYVRLRQRRRWLLLQVWLSLAVVGGLGLWVHMADRNLAVAAAAAESLRGQVEQGAPQQAQMDRLDQLRRQWRRQVEMLDRMGLHVEAARMLPKLAELMPPAVALLQLQFEVEETPATLGAAQRASLPPGAPPPVDRRLKARIQGVAPTDVEVVTLLTELNRVPFFQRVTPTYVRDRREAGHVLREFELAFEVNLNSPPQ